ncbi:hypothetical protein CA982_14600 [Gordonia lacunae]|uniref:Uncharacterized protein n=1 Tax=Gordonia lacunae TaxID=417102 RepID=A0A2C9ZIV5_9ACTN|nr:hypothetical protein CA982_14600 [Gordonia lacunae]
MGAIVYRFTGPLSHRGIAVRGLPRCVRQGADHFDRVIGVTDRIEEASSSFRAECTRRAQRN